jgi:hypothetical protein
VVAELDVDLFGTEELLANVVTPDAVRVFDPATDGG